MKQPRHATGTFGEKPENTGAAKASKGNGKGTLSDSDELAPGVPKKPVREPGADDPGFRARGGSVTGAFARSRKYAHGGPVTGPIMGANGGRADDKDVSVPAGAYVLPADVVSALGDGNSLGGHRAIEKMFGPSRNAAATGGEVPIRISDGEHVLDNQQVAKIGGGDHAQGCRILDSFCTKGRKKNIATLQKLPAPAK